MVDNRIPVVQPSLPPLEEFAELLKDAWETGILTHNGPLVQRFERELASMLGIPDMVAVTNGTIALQMAIKALDLKGEIITTPFTWIATTSAIKAEGCQPAYCDIDRNTFNLDPNQIEDYITEKSVAIMPVHVFGVPCDVKGIQAVANRFGLKVIYDAAHAIGSQVDGQSVLKWGDISATSFHATKLLNTAEGGACFSNNPEWVEVLRSIRFFGYNEDKEIVRDGFNGKMTEIHAALGLANLKYYDAVLLDRKEKCAYYRSAFEGIDSICLQASPHGESNGSYFPLVFDSEKILLRVVDALNAKNIFARRYFYPSLNTCSQDSDYPPLPGSESIASRILCLPLYQTLNYSEIDRVISVIKNRIA